MIEKRRDNFEFKHIGPGPGEKLNYIEPTKMKFELDIPLTPEELEIEDTNLGDDPNEIKNRYYQDNEEEEMVV